MAENLMANIFSVRFADEFEKELYRLSKKYRNIQRDVEPIIQQLEQGIILGDRLTEFASEIYVYKLRVKNSNIQKGKSAGYRLIYLLESATSILLLTQNIYQNPKKWREVATNLICFDLGKSQMEKIFNEFFDYKKEQFDAIMKLYKNPWDYLLLNLKHKRLFFDFNEIVFE
jgi:mRNA-degrading endonuclease RelE of RelBE toxin-antitoxin system